jgi:Phospholipase_D-nuclease N-terminal
MLASDFSFWDAIWLLIVFFAWIMFFTWVVMLLVDNFRRTDHGGGAKAGWALLIIFFPIVGAIIYTISRPDSAGTYEGYSSGDSSGRSPAEELSRLSDLRSQGAISDAEFEDLKARTIATS